MCESLCYLLYWFYPSAHLLNHPSITTQMAFQESLSRLMRSLCPSHTIMPTPPYTLPLNPPSTPHKALTPPAPHTLTKWTLPSWACWQSKVLRFGYKLRRKRECFSQKGWRIAECFSVRVTPRKEAPKESFLFVGPWGLSRRIIDDVFITRCGVMWGLGHNMCVCVLACRRVCVSGGGQVDSAAASLTPTIPAIGTDKSLLPNSLAQTHPGDRMSICTNTKRQTLTGRCTQTHSPEPVPFWR